MSDYARLEAQLIDSLSLRRRPVAVAFLDAPTPDVPLFSGTQPSSCSFWRLAAAGHVFQTVPSDHYNCPIGSYTHRLPLPAAREQELPQMLTQMSELGYIRMEEVPGIPRLPGTPGAIVYAPLGEMPVTADVVLVSGTPAQLMRLHEAATRAGHEAIGLLGRPTCMALPAALGSGVASSLGCIGNRVYTDLDDGESYTVVAGRALAAVAEQLATITAANEALAAFHRERRATLASV
jgi:uncharacterized protein (DUF169 family)